MGFKSNRPHPGSVFAPMLALLAIVLALVLYLRVLDNALHGPALILTQNNTQLQSQTPISTIWFKPAQLAGAEALVYRPMMLTLLRGQAAVWGTSPSSFHAMNLLLFVGGVALLLGLVCRLTGHTWARGAAVFCFMLHPLATQSVQSVAAQGGLLALDAMLGAGILLLATVSGRLRPWVAALGIALLAFVAAASHEMGLLLPVWLLLLAAAAPERAIFEATPLLNLPRRQRRKMSRTQAAPGLAAGTTVAETAAAPRGSAGLVIAVAVSLGCVAYLGLRWVALDSTLWTATPKLDALYAGAGRAPFSSAPAVMFAGLLRLIWPAWPTLTYEFSTGGGFFLPAWAGWLIWAVLLGGAIALLRRARLVGVALLMLAVTLAATAHWIPSEPLISEQALLFAIVPFALLLGAGAELLIESTLAFPLRMRGRMAAVALLCMACAMVWQTWNRAGAWRSEIALWQAEVARHPQSYSARVELLRAAMRARDYDLAERILAEARALPAPAGIDDDLTMVEANLLSASTDRGPLRELLQRELDSQEPHAEGALAKLGQQAYLAEQKDLAAQLLEKELARFPESFTAQYELADLEREAGNLERALKLADGAVRTAPVPMRARAVERLGIVLAEAKAIDQALLAFDQAIQLDPTTYESYVYRSRIFMGQQKYDLAEDAVERSRRFSRVSSYADLAQLAVTIYEARGEEGKAQSRAIYFADTYSSDIPTNIYAARYLISKGSYDPARKILERIYPSAGARMADVLVAIGLLDLYGDRNLERAIAKWEEARRLQPGHAEATRMLADARKVDRKRQQKQQYEEEMQRLMQRRPVPVNPSGAPTAAMPPSAIAPQPAATAEDTGSFPLTPATP